MSVGHLVSWSVCRSVDRSIHPWLIYIHSTLYISYYANNAINIYNYVNNYPHYIVQVTLRIYRTWNVAWMAVRRQDWRTRRASLSTILITTRILVEHRAWCSYVRKRFPTHPAAWVSFIGVRSTDIHRALAHYRTNAGSVGAVMSQRSTGGLFSLENICIQLEKITIELTL